MFALLFAVFMAAVPLFVFDRLDDGGMTQDAAYQGILTLWSVDGFEGGSGSRSEFLKGRAIEFEQKHKGVFVSVQNYTYEQVKQKLADGDKFDLISFSAGVGQELKGLLDRYSMAVNVRDDLLAGGKIGGDIFALPWAYGGYALFAFDDMLQKSGESLSVDRVFNCGFTKNDKHKTKIASLGGGLASFNNPFAALRKNGVSKVLSADAFDQSEYTSYQAYQSFLTKNKFSVLLGTQRDLSRLSLRQSQGKLDAMSSVYLSGFTDLVQYIGYRDNGGARGDYAQAFMQYLTSDAAQKRLTKIEMLSPALDIYASGMQDEMERALSGRLETVNAFTDAAILLDGRQNDRQYFFSGERYGQV